jgi:hypothetical protein
MMIPYLMFLFFIALALVAFIAWLSQVITDWWRAR